MDYTELDGQLRVLSAATQGRGAMAGLHELLVILAERGLLTKEDTLRVMQTAEGEMARFIGEMNGDVGPQRH